MGAQSQAAYAVSAKKKVEAVAKADDKAVDLTEVVSAASDAVEAAKAAGGFAEDGVKNANEPAVAAVAAANKAVETLQKVKADPKINEKKMLFLIAEGELSEAKLQAKASMVGKLPPLPIVEGAKITAVIQQVKAFKGAIEKENKGTTLAEEEEAAKAEEAKTAKEAGDSLSGETPAAA